VAFNTALRVGCISDIEIRQLINIYNDREVVHSLQPTLTIYNSSQSSAQNIALRFW